MAEIKTFISWRELKGQLLNDLSNYVGSGTFHIQSYVINSSGTGGSRSVNYKTVSELKAMIAWVDEKIEEEEGRDYYARTYPRNRGRG